MNDQTVGPVRQDEQAAIVVVVMGVSGSGKSSIGETLARSHGWDFQEGDSLHPEANIAKMSAGIPLTDEDRWPWLARVEQWMAERLRAGRSGVVTCSALRRIYRDVLRKAGAGVRFVYLKVDADELARRMRERHHFMPPSLLDSQLATLEEPQPEEQALVVTGSGDVQATVAEVNRRLAEGIHADRAFR